LDRIPERAVGRGIDNLPGAGLRVLPPKRVTVPTASQLRELRQLEQFGQAHDHFRETPETTLARGVFQKDRESARKRLPALHQLEGARESKLATLTRDGGFRSL